MKSSIVFASLSLAIGFPAIQSGAQESASPPASTIEVSEFNELVKGSKWDDAAAWVDAALKENPDSSKLLSLSLQLANQTMRAQPEAAAKRFSELIDKWCSSQKLTIESARNLYSATSMYSAMLMQKDRGPEAIEVSRRSLTTVAAAGDSVRAIRRDLESNLARNLKRAEHSADALALMRASFDNVKTGVIEGTDDLRDLVKVTNTFSGLFDDDNAEEVSDRSKYVENLLIQKLDAQPILFTNLAAYFSFRSAQLSQLIYSDPARVVPQAL